MQLDRMQKYNKSCIDSGFNDAINQLSSLQSDYTKAGSAYTEAASISSAADTSIFNPNQKVIQSKTTSLMNECRIEMAHDSAQAPQWQGAYQQWSAKESAFNASVAAQSNYNKSHHL